MLEKKEKIINKKQELEIFKFLLIETDNEKIKEYLKNYNCNNLQLYLTAALSKEMDNKIKENQSIYINPIEKYNNILINSIKLAKELKLNNCLEISTLFSYLLWNGYFSVNNKHEYTLEHRFNIHGFLAFDIFRGSGVCLNYSHMLKDFLIKANYNAVVLFNNIDEDAKSDYLPDINRNDTKTSIHYKLILNLSKFISKKIGNHAFTLIEDNEKCFIYDATNIIILKIDDYKKASLIIGSGESKIKPYLSYVYTTNELEKQIIEKYIDTDNYKIPYNRKDIIYTSEECVAYFNQNKSLIEDYYANNHNEILEIVDETIKIKKKAHH